MILRFGFVCLMLVGLAGCASSTKPFTYHVAPETLNAGKMRYFVEQPKLTLIHSHGADPASTQFATEEQLGQQFFKFIKQGLQEKGLLANSKAAADAVVDLSVDYVRTYNWGGKSLNKPRVSFMLSVTDPASKPLAELSMAGMTTNYGGFENTAVNMEISAFSWDEEDEPRDVELLSQTIVADLLRLGK